MYTCLTSAYVAHTHRHTFVAGTCTPDSRDARRLLHLTPVRRSTRKNRNGPGLELDHSMCFDSPSEVGVSEEYGGVEIVPNKALVCLRSERVKTFNDNTSGADKLLIM